MIATENGGGSNTENESEEDGRRDDKTAKEDALEMQVGIINMKSVENIQGAKEEIRILEVSRKRVEKEIEELCENRLQEESISEELLCSTMENREDKDKEHVLWSKMEIGVGAQVEVVEEQEGCDSETE